MKSTFGNNQKVKKHFFSDYLTDMFTRFAQPELTKYPGDVVLLPIPQNEIDRNSKIISNNPGY